MQSKLCLWLYTRYLGEEIKSRKNKSVCVGIDPGASKKTLFSRYSYTDYSYKSMAKYPSKLFASFSYEHGLRVAPLANFGFDIYGS